MRKFPVRIDSFFFRKSLLQSDKECCVRKGGHRLRFREKGCGKLHLDFEKLEHVIQPAWSTGVYGENYRR